MRLTCVINYSGLDLVSHANTIEQLVKFGTQFSCIKATIVEAHP